MKRIIVLVSVLIFLSGCVRPYVEGGLMVHSQSAARPEVNMPASDLGYAEIGVSRSGWDLFVQHLSTPSSFKEKGHGINSIGISKRVYLIN